MTVTRELDSRMWTNRLRNRFFGTFPPDKLLPDRQPAYVASWIYVFGVATIAALVMLFATGLVLTSKDPRGTTRRAPGTSSTACTSGRCSSS